MMEVGGGLYTLVILLPGEGVLLLLDGRLSRVQSIIKQNTNQG